MKRSLASKSGAGTEEIVSHKAGRQRQGPERIKATVCVVLCDKDIRKSHYTS